MNNYTKKLIELILNSDEIINFNNNYLLKLYVEAFLLDISSILIEFSYQIEE